MRLCLGEMLKYRISNISYYMRAKHKLLASTHTSVYSIDFWFFGDTYLSSIVVNSVITIRKNGFKDEFQMIPLQLKNILAICPVLPSPPSPILILYIVLLFSSNANRMQFQKPKEKKFGYCKYLNQKIRIDIDFITIDINVTHKILSHCILCIKYGIRQ